MKFVEIITIAVCMVASIARSDDAGYTRTVFEIGATKINGIAHQNIADTLRSRVEEDMGSEGFPMFRALALRFMEGQHSVYAIKIKVDEDSFVVIAVAGGFTSPILLGTTSIPKGQSFAGYKVELHTYITKNDYYSK